MNITFTDVVFFYFLVVLFFIWLIIIKTKIKMEKTQRMFESENIFPEGSDISHGMSLTENNEIVGCEKPNLNWISKLGA